jgi:hypothetical protein
MIERRDFLKLPLVAAGLSAMGLCAPWIVESAIPRGRRLIDGFVIDSRFPESRHAGADLRFAGVRRHEVDGDVTSLWYDHLDAAWRNAGGGLAGLTGKDVLFVLARLAWDRRRKLYFRGLHSPTSDGRIEHRLSGSATLVGELGVALDGAFHPAALGRQLCEWRGETGPARVLVTSGRCGTASGRTAPLVSWIIAPAGRGTNPADRQSGVEQS